MESKEKAIELYNKFYNTSSHSHHVETRQQIAKECALILVSETIMELCSIWANYDNIEEPIDERVGYWENVRKEIEKL